jgi:hypothetical protein
MHSNRLPFVAVVAARTLEAATRTTRSPLVLPVLLALHMLLVPSASAQQRSQPRLSGLPAEAFAPVPFAVGETFEFRMQAKWAFVRGGGTASMAVQALDTVRGHPSYRLAFRTKGGITVFKINDVQRSWLDARELFAHRFEQKLNQTGYSRDRTYEFFPGEMRYFSEQNPSDSGTLATELPLDDVSFIYFIRTLPLNVGDVYTAARYFRSDGNPVTVRVLRRERITVPAGSFNAVVVKPIIRTKGLFSEGGEAEIWFTDDPRHMPLRVRAKVSIATLTMELQSFTAGDTPD